MRAALLALAVVLLACGESPGGPAAPPATRLGVAVRVAVVGESPREECLLGGERRPGFGCLEPLRLVPGASEQSLVTIRNYYVPGHLRGSQAVVERRYRRAGERRWQTLPSLLIDLDRNRKQVPLEVRGAANGGVDASIRFLAAPRLESERTSEPFPVSEGAVLAGALGLDGAGLERRGGPVRFVIEALRAGGADGAPGAEEAEGEPGPEPVRLLERVVAPRDEGDRWIDYRLDLGAFAGGRVTLRLRVEAAPAPPGAPRRPGRSFALWSQPLLEEPLPDPAAPNLLIVSLDTLRADALGALGSPHGATPHLDALASESAVFENAMAPFPSTSASHMSLFTGTYPNVHEVFSAADRVADQIPLLAERVAQAGLVTQAYTEDGMLHAVGGFARGFDGYLELRGGSSLDTPGRIERVFDHGLRWLREHRELQSFLFLHTYQVHSPYEPPKDFDNYADAFPGDAVAKAHADYMGEVAYTDAQVQRLLDGLRELGLLERTVLVVTSDHGEGFGEHSVGHSQTLYQPELHVPLLIHAPGRLPAGRYAAPVSLVDLVPTALDLLGLPAARDVQGRSLRELVASPAAPEFAERPVFAQFQRGVAARLGDRKWILEPAGPRDEAVLRAYDLARDPGERHPLEDPGQGAALVDAYARAGAELRARLGEPESGRVEVDEETKLELQALGYLEPEPDSDSGSDVEDGASAP